MARNALAVLARIRDAAVTQAQRDLAHARAGELLHVNALEAQRRLMAQEQEAATTELLPEFVVWLPIAQSQAAQRQFAVAREQARVEACQRALGLRRVEAEAVLKALERRRAHETLIQSRKDQAAMDEVAGRSRQAGR